MGVVTSADKKRNDAKDKIEEAIELLKQTTNEDYGWNDYGDSYKASIYKAIATLFEVNTTL